MRRRRRRRKKRLRRDKNRVARIRVGVLQDAVVGGAYEYGVTG